MRKSFFFFLLLLSCNEKSQEPKLLIKDFFISYETRGLPEALDNIFKTNEWLLEQSKDGINKIKDDLLSYISHIGNYCGYEILSERSIGKHLKHYVCIVKYDRQLLRFSFVFYKAESLWVLYSFKYDQTLVEEIEETAKFYYLE